MEEKDIKRTVRDRYAEIARTNGSCCGPTASCGCTDSKESMSKQIGYTDEDINSVPEGADMGLGCGNPTALASLKEGEIVLDLGSGGGFDCFLAASRVGATGRVIGVDMTPDMLDRARENARKGGYENVEFRLGEIENLPVADGSVDVVISNCVINLSPDKRRVFGEAFRVLKPGGRMMVSDLVLSKELPDALRNSVASYVGCIAGAMLRDDYLSTIREVGFDEIDVVEETTYPLEVIASDETFSQTIGDVGLSLPEAEKILGTVLSIKIQGFKPPVT